MAEEPAKIRLDTSMVCRLQTVKRFQLLLFSESERPRPKLTLYVILKQLFTISNSRVLLFKGEIECELYWRHAPKTCRNFKELVGTYLLHLFKNPFFSRSA